MKTFFLFISENTLVYIWKYFALNIRADSSRLPQTVLLSYGHADHHRHINWNR